MKIGRLALLFLAACAACEGPAGPAIDAAGADGGSDAGPITPCARDLECGAQDLYCSEWRCRPGEPGADARGCIDLGSPCAAGVECDEDADACGLAAWCTEGRTGCMEPGNCDGDGEPSMECGGRDCDDGDGVRYPGAVEVCDADDEDCNDETLGERDADGDGFHSAECCNGDVCADDCDDSRRDVHPGAAEACNAIDDDCDGAIDEAGSTSLCPGGTCSGGRCDLRAWDRVWGTSGEPGPGDYADSVAMDERGNVYIVGSIYGPTDFGAGSVPATADTMYVVSFSGDGVFRWSRTYGAAGARVRGQGIAFDRDAGVLYVAGLFDGTVDFGSDTLTSDGLYNEVLLALAPDGADRWLRKMPASFGGDGQIQVAARGGRVVALGYMASAWDFGGGTVTPEQEDLYVVSYDSLGAFRALSRFPTTWGTALELVGVDIWPDGRVLFGGDLALGNLQVGTETLSSGTRGFIVALETTGSYAWHRRLAVSGSARATAVVSSEAAIYVAGVATSADLGGGAGPTGARAFLLALESDGSYRWDRRFTGTASIEPRAAAVDSAGNVVLAGDADGSADLGSGTRTLPPGATAISFVLSVRSDNVHRWDTVFGNSGATRVLGLTVGHADSTAFCGRFSGGADFGSGPRAAGGASSAFVARLAN